MKVSVIIPNCNGANFLSPCLESLGMQSEKEFKIIIVDNGSTDSSLQIIEDETKKLVAKGFDEKNIVLIRNQDNLGFCGGVNTGILKVDTEFCILLNNDTVVDKDFVKESVKGIEESKKIFSVSAKMIQMHNKSLIDSAGDGYTILGWGFPNGNDKPVENYDTEKEVFSACGGAAIYRTELVKALGMFDENHFAYLEDVDLGYRARIFGYKNMYNPKAVVYHAGSGFTGSRYNEFKISKAARNNIFLIYKNMPLLQLIINFCFIFAGCLGKYVFFLRKDKKFARAYVDGIMEGLADYKKCKKVKYDKKNFTNYLEIEKELIVNTFICIKEKTSN